MVLVRMKKIFILLTLGWMAILTASAQGSPVEQFNQAQADALQASAAGNYEGTLVNALLYHCKDSLSGINGVMRPGIVHRIDKDTSGLLIVAKNDF